MGTSGVRNLRSQLRGLRACCVSCCEGCVPSRVACGSLREAAGLLWDVFRTKSDFLRVVAGIGSTRLTTFDNQH